MWGDACSKPDFLTTRPVAASSTAADVAPVLARAAAERVARGGQFATRGCGLVEAAAVQPVVRPVRAGEVRSALHGRTMLSPSALAADRLGLAMMMMTR